MIKPCVICKKFNNLSYRYPRMTDLPKDRINLIRPYLNIGVDFIRFIMVKEGKNLANLDKNDVSEHI